ncbi:TonB-dependent receptor plug domain-containing protein [Ideonella sp. YS5]|uniref:TonB-dependent receptor plug domain-containing protein n=1 Tax=Ideonella sp. YS5 TaxID=3453714 RepID=UPI003EEF76E1
MSYRHRVAAHGLRLTLLSFACASLASPAWCEEDPSATPQKVEVTGSRIKRIDAEGASPVQVLNRVDIERSGATTTAEFLSSLSSATGGLSDLGGNGSFAPGASAPSLRNLGKQSTLVLLNSRRIAAYPLADYSEVFSNIDTLPLEAIDRIEILKSGGSALYGSDAVAGVINIITRSNYQGLQLNASAEQSLQNGKFQAQTAALTGGIGSLDGDGYSVLANLEVYHRASFFWSDVIGDSNPAYAAFSPSFGTPSTFSYPGNVIGVGPVQGCQNVTDGLCLYDRYQRFEVVPATDRTNLLVSGRMRLADSLTGFSEVLLSHIESIYQSAYQPYGQALGPTIWGDPLTGGLKFFDPRGLPVGHPLNPTDEEVEFRYRFVDGPPVERTTTDQYRVLAGLQGMWDSYDWELAGGVMGGRTRDRQRGGFSDSGFKQVIGDYTATTLPPDFFNKPDGYRIGQPNSAAVLDTLFPTYGYTGTIVQAFVDGKITGDIARWDSGNVGLATGFDLRHEQARITPSQSLATGDIVGNGLSSSDASRSYEAVFAELSLPLMKTLEAQVAGRLDHFPGFPTHFSPKVGLRYQPVPELLLRGTYEGGFRAPNLNESAKSTKFSFEPGVDDPKRCPQAVALSTDLRAQAEALPKGDPGKSLLLARADSVAQNECGANISGSSLNNPNLKPETSRAFTLGIGLQPAARWNATVDYWNIHRRNEIGLRGTSDLLAVEDSLPAGTLTRGTLADDPTFTAAEQAQYGVKVGPLQSVRAMFQNLFQTKTAGVDLSVKGEVPTTVGPVSIDIDATYLLSYRAWSNARNGFGDNMVGRYGMPRWNVNLTGGLQTGDFRQAVRFVWSGATSLQGDFDDTTWSSAGCDENGIAAKDCRMKAYQRWDYSLSYSGIQDLVLGLHLNNVFNQRPPVDLRAFGFDGIIPPSAEDVQGRLLKLTLQYKFS